MIINGELQLSQTQILVDKEITKYSTVKERGTAADDKLITSYWKKDWVNQADIGYWTPQEVPVDPTLETSDKPATCYKGIRSRERICHPDAGDTCINECVSDNAPPPAIPVITCTRCTDEPKCAHIDSIREGATQTQYIAPGVNGGLPECGLYTF